MKNIDTRKLASIIAVFYVVFFLSGIFIHYYLTGEIYTLKYSFSLPRTWLVASVGILVSYGVWNQFRWGWWLGLIGVLYQLIGIIPRIIKLWPYEGVSLMSTIGMNVVCISFISFFIILILPSTRKLCSR